MDWNYPERPLDPPEDTFSGTKYTSIKAQEVEYKDRYFSVSGDVSLTIDYGEETDSEIEDLKVEEYHEDTDTVIVLSDEELNQEIPDEKRTWRDFFEQEVYSAAIDRDNWNKFSQKELNADKEYDEWRDR